MIDTLRAEAAAMQQAIDVYSALCLACANNPSPDVIEKRQRLERSLNMARTNLKRIKEQLL
jgi:hypothetical protein